MDYNIVVASSMRNSCRYVVEQTATEVNHWLNLFGVDIHFNVLEYGRTPIDDLNEDTQRLLNEAIAASDILVLLADNNATIGDITMIEYYTAQKQSSQSAQKRPYIKAFGLLDQENEPVNITYKKEDGTLGNFENLIYEDSKRYLQYVEREKFKESFLKDWLIAIACNGLNHNQTQKELSYGNHLHTIGQGFIRRGDQKYYRREKLDGQIEKILKSSPIVIIEGNTYSGKTRAAFEIMKQNKEWEDYFFHIYDNRHKATTLNRIKLNFARRGDIYLFDDINDIIKDGGDIDLESSLWSQLNGYNERRGFDIEDWNNTRIIITVAGHLSETEKRDLYRKIFNTSGVEFETKLKEIIVNFDIYDPQSFRQMVNEMKRDGIIISTSTLNPGNNTIGSLFIRYDEIRSKLEEIYSKNKALMTAIAGHYKFATKSNFAGVASEIKELYDYCADIKNISAGVNTSGYETATKEDFSVGIERLRKEGLVVTQRERAHLSQIWVDQCIFDIISEVVNANIRLEDRSCADPLNCLLVEYARECETSRGSDDMLSKHRICYMAQLGYLLIDRNTLSDSEIIHLIGYIATQLSIDRKAITPLLKYEANVGVDHRFIMQLTTTLVDIAKQTKRYPQLFATSAIASLNDFGLAYKIIKASYAYHKQIKENELREVALNLYKQVIFSMLSTSKRSMTMRQEQQILNLILDNDENWIEPFGEEDLSDLFNLTRITPFIKNRSAQDIIKLLPAIKLDGSNMDIFVEEQSQTTPQTEEEEGFDFSTLDNDSVEQQEDNRNIYEKIFLVKLSDAIIAAIARINSYKEFKTIVKTIVKMCKKSAHIKRAIEKSFAGKFYNAAPKIVKRLHYADRAKFFDFIFSIEDCRGVLRNTSISDKESIGIMQKFRIIALNRLLGHLDENDALNRYNRMLDSNLSDAHTLSMLFKNEFMNFEQLLLLSNRDNGQTNFITHNQLMGKAETMTDANVCLRLMGITNADPSKLRDEYALIKYLKTKEVNCRRCIETIKERRKRYPHKLSDSIIGVLLQKLQIEQFADILFPTDSNHAEGYYMEQYGLTDEEVESVRKNAIHFNKFILKANDTEHSEEISNKIKARFNEIINREDLRYLITDPDQNGNNAILSAYMKYRFSDYEGVKRFYDELPQNCRPQKSNNSIYNVFLWYIVNDYNRKRYKKEEAISLLNKELTTAFNDFAEHYTKEEVERMMANLYGYRLKLTKNNCYDHKEEYVYEGEKLELSYKEYLRYLKEHNTNYINNSFIYVALVMMSESIDEQVYSLLGDIAVANHIGVQYDSIYKRHDKDGPKLSKQIQSRLLSYDTTNDRLIIDERLVYNISYIKVLWFMTRNDVMSFEEAEECRIKNGIPITQTYLNMAFKCMERSIIADYKDSGHKKEFLTKGYNRMIEYIKTHITDQTTYLSRSIQMALSLIAVAPDEGILNRIFLVEGFKDFENKPEVITARMNKILNLRHKSDMALRTISEFKDIIITNCENINIRTINAYISIYVKVSKFELFAKEGKMFSDTPHRECWSFLKENRKVDVFRLLGLRAEDERRELIIKKLGLTQEESWVIDANVQTLSYFAKYEPRLISKMYEMFDGDFTYDENGRLSCLKDAIKNYAFFYESSYKKDKDELRFIAEILLQKSNNHILDELCDEYIIKSHSRDEKWSRVNLLWLDLLKNQGICEYIAQHISFLANKMSEHRGAKRAKLAYLNIEDANRINALRRAFHPDNIGSKIYSKIRKRYKEIEAKLENTPKEATRNNAAGALKLLEAIFWIDCSEV